MQQNHQKLKIYSPFKSPNTLIGNASSGIWLELLVTLSLEKMNSLLSFVHLLEDGYFCALIRSFCERFRVEQATCNPGFNISALLRH